MCETTAAISAEYQTRYRELFGDKHPNVLDPRYWELEDWYRRQHQGLIDAREDASKPVPVGVVVSEDGGGRVCECGGVIVKKPGRGRWPVRCGKCRGIETEDENNG